MLGARRWLTACARPQICTPGISRSKRMGSLSMLSTSPYIDPDFKIDGDNSAEGPLRGLTFAVKDLYDVEGRVTGHGNPVWRQTHSPATKTAPTIQACLAAGADLRGITHMDELAFSLNGENVHYGTPTNPACPDRIPGGSSSGSVSAVAAGDVDFAFGSDTGGSVRVPASFCGVPGLRPTWGRVSMDLTCPLAPSYDTGGWHAQDLAIMQRVGKVVLQPHGGPTAPIMKLLIPTEAVQLAEESTQAAFRETVKGFKLDGLTLEEVHLGDVRGGLAQWLPVFTVVQSWEAWQALGGWVSQNEPKFGPGIKERFEYSRNLPEDEYKRWAEAREEVRSHMQGFLKPGSALLMPTAPGPAPLLQMDQGKLNAWRKALITLTSIAGIASLPQLSLPLMTVDGCPVGVSLVGAHGADEALIDLGIKLTT